MYRDSPTLDRIVTVSQRRPVYGLTYGARSATPPALAPDTWWSDSDGAVYLADESGGYSLPIVGASTALAWAQYIYDGGDVVMEAARDDFNHPTGGARLTMANIDVDLIPDAGALTVSGEGITALVETTLWAAIRAPKDTDETPNTNLDVERLQNWNLIARHGHGQSIGDTVHIDGERWGVVSVRPWDKRRSYDTVTVRRVT